MSKLIEITNTLRQKIKESKIIDDEHTEIFDSMVDKLVLGINNIITNINNSIKLMSDSGTQNQEVKEKITEIITKVTRMAGILDDLVKDLNNKLNEL
tara:strand:- start:1684 stop:1974 length:291 start_codon:yes stop_codon:yes gene_type:complete